MIKSSSAAPEKEIVTSVSKLNGKTPTGDLNDKWSKYKSSIKLVNPANKRKFNVIVVGTGLAELASATLAELGYNVKTFASKIHLEELTVLLLKVELMLLKITKMMVIVFIGFLLIQLKVGTIEPERLMFIG